MLDSVNRNVLELERLYKMNIIDFMNHLVYKRDVEQYKEDLKNGDS